MMAMPSDHDPGERNSGFESVAGIDRGISLGGFMGCQRGPGEEEALRSRNDASASMVG
jgi:hypothetical protein